MSDTTQHIFIDKQHPAVWRALNGLGLKAREAAEEAGIDRKTIELLYMRISQINGCAYCLDMHVQNAVDAGETPQRLAVLPAWRETALFTEKERAFLALAESVTELPDHCFREQDEASAREHLSADEFSAVNWLAITMNAFNRVSIVSHHPVRRHR
ncbi:carboxymuconolactone decarboxylase family protein [Arthrobacter sp. ISL-48]|uniref:carboxymuconolactone decarboxylase family protein n=1 Tax=Arthrobacter sp. ISL-48 TaxID=2819110 RepID=UPI001BECC75F|nr:carboxymuconolactone decarboxylase family protein [Arthrobacter sp. ISL-48]MBT2533445.1 carboxymuconolactone decarboxylase family protein [Arthrobacter sp. ISL-48]